MWSRTLFLRDSMSVYDKLGDELAGLHEIISKDYGCNPIMVSKRTKTRFVNLERGGVMMILTGWDG